MQDQKKHYSVNEEIQEKINDTQNSTKKYVARHKPRIKEIYEGQKSDEEFNENDFSSSDSEHSDTEQLKTVPDGIVGAKIVTVAEVALESNKYPIGKGKGKSLFFKKWGADFYTRVDKIENINVNKETITYKAYPRTGHAELVEETDNVRFFKCDRDKSTRDLSKMLEKSDDKKRFMKGWKGEKTKKDNDSYINGSEARQVALTSDTVDYPGAKAFNAEIIRKTNEETYKSAFVGENTNGDETYGAITNQNITKKKIPFARQRTIDAYVGVNRLLVNGHFSTKNKENIEKVESIQKIGGDLITEKENIKINKTANI